MPTDSTLWDSTLGALEDPSALHITDPTLASGRVLDDRRIAQLEGPSTQGWEQGGAGPDASGPGGRGQRLLLRGLGAGRDGDDLRLSRLRR